MNASVSRGFVAGFIAAAAFAVWFLLVDFVKEQPLASLAYLSGLLFSFTTALPATARLAAFLLFHFLVFGLIGAIVSRFARMLPMHWMVVGILLGVVLTAGMYAAGVVVFDVDAVRGLGWPHVVVANLIAGAVLASALRAR